MVNNLRNIERQVLNKLEINSRTPFSSIGKQLGKSQQQISYTVNSLIKRNILQGFYSLIDYSTLDVLSFRVYFRVSYISKEKFDELIDFLIKDSHTSWVQICGGRYDLICTFFTSNPSQFNKTLKQIIEKFPVQLQDYLVLTTIVTRFFGKKHLFKDFSNLNEVIVGGDRLPEEIDEVDLQILDMIAEDSRKSSVDIANKLSLTAKTIIDRINKLRKRNILLGFKPFLNPRNMGYTPRLLLIKYHNFSLEMENKLIMYLKAHPDVVSAVKTLGEWDIEIEIETQNLEELRRVEMEIRQRFALLIQQVESITLYQAYKKNYFPKFLVENLKIV